MLTPAGAESPAWGQADAAPGVVLVFEYPADGIVVGPGACGLLVVGRLGPPELDVVIALDTSVSTAAASGDDVDGDGVVGGARFGRVGATMGEFSSDPDDTVLSVEVAAARRLIERLDPRRTRIALVTFSGGPADLARGEPVLPDASTRVPLTSERERLSEGLDALLRETPAGGTHMGAGVDRATIELLGLEGAASRADPRRARLLVLFTDGTPTRPYGPDRSADNVRAALAAADRARKARVRIFTVAIGREALERPLAPVEIAARTGGVFLPVRDAGDLGEAMGALDLAPALGVELRNRTSGEAARVLRRSADGSFGGFVPLVQGPNTIEAVAHAEGGASSTRTLRITRDDAAPPPLVPHEYDFLDDGVGAFAACLRQVPRVDLSAEELQREQVRQQLLLEMERERARAREQAEAQRKELELEAEAP